MKVQNKTKLKKLILRHIILYVTVKIKRVSKKLHYVMYRGPPIRPSAEFSAEISEARKVWHNIFKVLTGEGKEKKKKLLKKNILSNKVIIQN